VSLLVRTRQVGAIQVVEPEGELEVYTAPRVREVLEELTAVDECRVCLSLQNVTFLDSKGIGVIVEGTKRARRAGGELVVLCESERFMRHFRILKLEEYLALAESMQDAVGRLGKEEAGHGADPA